MSRSLLHHPRASRQRAIRHRDQVEDDAPEMSFENAIEERRSAMLREKRDDVWRASIFLLGVLVGLIAGFWVFTLWIGSQS